MLGGGVEDFSILLSFKDAQLKGELIGGMKKDGIIGIGSRGEAAKYSYE